MNDLPRKTQGSNPLRALGRGWLRAGEVAAHGLGLVIFTILFVLVFGPYAILARLAGKRFLPRFTGQEGTYFLPKDPIEPTLEWASKQG